LNSVMRDNDPSAHAEVNAIREACRKAGNPHIVDAVLYSSCEPCPMCSSTAYWARIGKIFYAASWTAYADLSTIPTSPRTWRSPTGGPAADHAARRAEGVGGKFRRLPDRARY
jgi:guanine deaminase